jgi:hypothetical protein
VNALVGDEFQQRFVHAIDGIVLAGPQQRESERGSLAHRVVGLRIAQDGEEPRGGLAVPRLAECHGRGAGDVVIVVRERSPQRGPCAIAPGTVLRRRPVAHSLWCGDIRDEQPAVREPPSRPVVRLGGDGVATGRGHGSGDGRRRRARRTRSAGAARATQRGRLVATAMPERLTRAPEQRHDRERPQRGLHPSPSRHCVPRRGSS